MNRGSRFVWTEHGQRVHISDGTTDAGMTTRCGWLVSADCPADDVFYFWPPCSKCTRSCD